MWLADMEILGNIKKSTSKNAVNQKTLATQTVGNELIHCHKLSGKTKHIQKKN